MSTLADAPTRVAAPDGIRRLGAAGAPGFAAHRAAFGPLPAVTGVELAGELRAAGLDGRGGGGFPAWRKLSALATSGRRPVVVANAAEGEPLSAKDLALLHFAPHLVIDGLLALAAAVHASEAYLYCQAAAVPAVVRACAERADARSIQVRQAATGFVAGEASAVVEALSGRRPVPVDRVMRLTERGVGARPTLLHNVETLAHLALIVRFGNDWFRSLGTAGQPGTRLVSVSTETASPQVLEIAGGSSIRSCLDAAGVDADGLSAVLVGGYHGTWVPRSALSRGLDAAELAPYGATPGAGILQGIARGRCPLTVAGRIAGYLTASSARQCGPCVNGLPAMAAVLARLARGDRDPALPGEVARLAALVTGRGSCHHPDGTARFVLSTLTVFAADVGAHLQGTCGKDHS